jgi:hypothetical protein
VSAEKRYWRRCARRWAELDPKGGEAMSEQVRGEALLALAKLRREYQTQREPDATAVLLREIGRLHAENVKLRGRVRALERSRDRWRAEAKAWKWGAMQR